MFKYNWCLKRIPPPLVSNQVPFLKKKKESTIEFACQVSSVSLILKNSYPLPCVFHESGIFEILGHCLMECSTVKTGLILQCSRRCRR